MQEFKNKKHGSGTTTLIIANEEMDDIMKTVQALEDSNILLKAVTKTIKNEIKEQQGGFLNMLLGTLGPSLLGNVLAGKWIVTAGSANKKGKGIVRAGTGKQWATSSFTNFEMQKYYENEQKLNDVFSRNNLPRKMKDGAYIINLDKYADVGTH